MAPIVVFRCSRCVRCGSMRSGGWYPPAIRSNRQKGWRPSPPVCSRRWRKRKRARIRVTAIERELGTRYTADTLQALTRRYPKREFVWLMGSDNLAQFHRWRDWRGIARTMPIAVIARPGYDAAAIASPAMAWLRRFSVPLPSFVNRGEWSAPALVTLRFDPDERSATAIRRADPDWALRYAGPSPRDQLTHRRIPSGEETTAP